MDQEAGVWSSWLPSLHVAKRMAPLHVGAIFYAALVATFLSFGDHEDWKAGTEWVAINGLVLGTLLVFRNKEAYERWWEARKLWGQLINDLRNLALKVKAHVEPTADEAREFARLLSAFPVALKCHLRGDEDLHHVPGFEKAQETTDHLPQYIAGLVFAMLARWNKEGRLNDTTLILDQHARALMDVCGACERIRSSPLPYSYRVLLRHGISLYLVLAPWSMCLENGFWGVPVLAVVFYFLLGIEFIAEDVEEPFGTDQDDIPLEGMCEKIGKSIEEILGR